MPPVLPPRGVPLPVHHLSRARFRAIALGLIAHRPPIVVRMTVAPTDCCPGMTVAAATEPTLGRDGGGAGMWLYVGI